MAHQAYEAVLSAKAWEFFASLSSFVVEQVIGFYSRFGFRRVANASLRLFLPAASLEAGAAIPKAHETTQKPR